MKCCFALLYLGLLQFPPAVSTGLSGRYKFQDNQGGIFIVRTDNKISKKLKKKIAALDGVAAWNEFNKFYGPRLKSARLLVSADQKTQRKQQKNEKRNFLRSLNEVKMHNIEYKSGSSKYETTMNIFSTMDSWEKEKHLGLGKNISQEERPTEPDGLEACRNKYTSTRCQTIKLNGQCDENGEQCELTCGRCGEFKLPETLDWNARGYVTSVKDQMSCGSCWTYSAVSVMEWIYKKTTGNLMQLSVQELLDCTYDAYDAYDGCTGGFPEDAWKYVRDTSRLASSSKYPYANSDGECNIRAAGTMEHINLGNEIAGKFQLGNPVLLPPNLDGLVKEAVNTMVLTVAIYVSKDTNSGFFQLNEGIFDSFVNCPAGRSPNHVIALVGYGPDYWEIKNSWGVDWGNNGFGRLLRGEGVNMCGILNNVAYVGYTDLNHSDGESDFPREAVVEEDTEVDDCFDDPEYAGVGMCPYWATEQGYCTQGDYVTWMAENCQKSCKLCAQSCDPGYILAPGTSLNCQICPANSYNNLSRARSCTVCSAGSWSLSGASTSDNCTECQPGTHLSPDTNRCETCPTDTYSSYGATSCTQCPEGSRSAPGSTDDSDCIIPPEDCSDALPEYKCQEFMRAGNCVGGKHVTTAKWGCKKTCAFCQVVAVCENKYESDSMCDEWAELGYCEHDQYNGWMEENCIKSCGHCEVEECADLEQYCSAWASDGYCSESSEYQPYMAVHCSKSCEFCSAEEAAQCTYQPDSHRYCTTWAEQGYCTSSTYTEFMTQQCSTSCRLCPHQNQGTVPVCAADDPTQSCDYFAKLGYCRSTWSSYMQTYCATTCGLHCAGACRDNNQFCMNWATQGQCDSNPYYMNLNCKSSCNQCYENSVSNVRGVPGCQDRNEYCEGWARQGYCTTNRAYMAGNCALSCDTCVEKGSCEDSNSYCGDWAASGECQRNRVYMLENCKSSCNACDGVSSGTLNKR